VLDLQSTDLGLLIPRVNLTDAAGQSALATTNVKGMIVYNTGTGEDGAGIYYNDGSKWTKISSGVTSVTIASNGLTSTGGTTPEIGLPTTSTNGVVLKYNTTTSKWEPQADAQGVTSVTGSSGISVTNGTTAAPALTLTPGTASGQVMKWNGSTWAAAADAGLTAEVDGIVGNEITTATTGGGLERTGSGTAVAPYTLGIATNGVTTARIADNAITTAKIADGGVALADLATGSVNSAKIVDASIVAADLATGAVTAVKLANMGAAAGNVLTYSAAGWGPTQPLTVKTVFRDFAAAAAGSYVSFDTGTSVEGGVCSIPNIPSAVVKCWSQNCEVFHLRACQATAHVAIYCIGSW
jgi:hypothetical protein